MTARECWFCFVPATAALCSGQAAFNYSHSQGSRLQIKPVWKTQGESELERSPGVAPCPCLALPKATAPREKPAEPARAGRAAVVRVQEPLVKLYSHLPEGRAMEGAQMLRKRARQASCSLPACFLLASYSPCLM